MNAEQIRELKRLINAYVDSRVRLSHSGRLVQNELRKSELNAAEKKDALDVFIESVRE